ncbi:aromatic-ring-hydroxylating dioxygenase subunit beta [Streptomyces griseoruber]|uniref:aromatic-ring-hydroxylating dioxygenase subunit beta n=1 Tax=Streptomyces griseoruber TaxID=1943 RepID=UPI0006E3DF41|nr:aromatic-ring-hydroxylating dioxygenase subunit beta [Streptomyces griseoruber]
MTDLIEAPAPPLPEHLPFPEGGTRRPELDGALRSFFDEESAALDERRHQEWLDLLDPLFLYQVPVPLLREDPSLPRHSERAMLFEATKGVLAMKLGRMGLRHAWSDRPAGVTRHFLGSVRVFALSEPGTLRVDCSVLSTWSRGRDEGAFATVGRQDVVRDLGAGMYRLLRRRVLFDTEVPTHEQLSIIF